MGNDSALSPMQTPEGHDLYETVAGRDAGTVMVVTCAGCDRDLLGESERAWRRKLQSAQRARLPHPVAGRVFGRPYCDNCLSNSNVFLPLSKVSKPEVSRGNS